MDAHISKLASSYSITHSAGHLQILGISAEAHGGSEIALQRALRDTMMTWS